MFGHGLIGLDGDRHWVAAQNALQGVGAVRDILVCGDSINLLHRHRIVKLIHFLRIVCGNCAPINDIDMVLERQGDFSIVLSPRSRVPRNAKPHLH